MMNNGIKKTKLYFTNLERTLDDNERYRLKLGGEVKVDDEWDGDIENFLKRKHTDYPHPEDLTYYKEYPYSSSIDRNGIYGEEEVFCEFDDGDLWSMTFYYTKTEKV